MINNKEQNDIMITEKNIGIAKCKWTFSGNNV